MSLWQIVEVRAPESSYRITFEVAGHRMTTFVRPGRCFEARVRRKLNRMAASYLARRETERS